MGENSDMNKYRLVVILSCLSCFLITGCVSTKEDVFDQSEMKTMREIYDEHFGGKPADVEFNDDHLTESNKNIQDKVANKQKDECKFANPSKYYHKCKHTRHVVTEPDVSESDNKDEGIETVDYTAYTREAMNELELNFKEFPNPLLIMYVYSHISDGNIPVPGYTTGFRMFKSVPFALPGEIRE